MKRILLMLALVMARCGSGGGTLAFAQSCPTGRTLVQDTLYGPVADASGNPTLFFGTVTIAANSAGHGASGAAFGRIPLTLTISNGVFSACLIPNDTAIPLNTTYTARFAYTGDQGAAAPWTETWSVPTSGSPVTLAASPAGVRLLTTPPLLQGAAGPAGASGTGNPPYSATVTSQTSLTVSAATHGQGVIVTAYCWNSAGAISCQAVPDSLGNVTFTWTGGFTGGITILGGGSGPRGAQGIQGAPGPVGPMGSLGAFGPLPTTPGSWCPQVVVTAGPSYAYGFISCGPPLTLAALSNSQLASLTNPQLATMTNGTPAILSLSALSNAGLSALTNSLLLTLTN